MFEKASRLKLRFDTPKGQITTEDLWDLPLTSQTGKANLDDIARSLDKLCRESPHKSFVAPEENAGDALTQLKFQVVLKVIEVRVAENAARLQASEKAAKKQQLMEVLARKQNAQLESMPIEELQAMINSL